ncbi:TRAP transporter small permease subunit [Oceanobacillus salinisoli]|uniref:TRAP transporter small permease subunit n=1 Tax=Oceanobacillus salinisoli TaxID=2678611 RepID=UPI0012E2C9DE|nr:TRAP transporter small permease subunit [Oceanobacillus salinisoli]
MISIIESLGEWAGKIASWFVLAVILILTYEVISRHLFNSPTIWAYDLSYMLGGSAAFLGMAWVLKNKQHIRVDVFYERLSERKKAIYDIVLALILLFPLLIVGFVNSLDVAILSLLREEAIVSGSWRPLAFPIRMVIPLSLGLLFLQGLADLIRNIYLLLGRRI